MRQLIPMNAQKHQALAHTVIAAWAGTSAMGDAGARNPVGLRTGDGNSQPASTLCPTQHSGAL